MEITNHNAGNSKYDQVIGEFVAWYYDFTSNPDIGEPFQNLLKEFVELEVFSLSCYEQGLFLNVISEYIERTAQAGFSELARVLDVLRRAVYRYLPEPGKPLQTVK
jgi:hypothetical protein